MKRSPQIWPIADDTVLYIAEQDCGTNFIVRSSFPIMPHVDSVPHSPMGKLHAKNNGKMHATSDLIFLETCHLTNIAQILEDALISVMRDSRIFNTQPLPGFQYLMDNVSFTVINDKHSQEKTATQNWNEACPCNETYNVQVQYGVPCSPPWSMHPQLSCSSFERLDPNAWPYHSLQASIARHWPCLLLSLALLTFLMFGMLVPHSSKVASEPPIRIVSRNMLSSQYASHVILWEWTGWGGQIQCWMISVSGKYWQGVCWKEVVPTERAFSLWRRIMKFCQRYSSHICKVNCWEFLMTDRRLSKRDSIFRWPIPTTLREVWHCLFGRTDYDEANDSLIWTKIT